MMAEVYYLPVVHNEIPALKDVFARWGVRFGMACEAYSFDSSVQAPLIKKHCAVCVPEVSGKMVYTQPDKGRFDFTGLDALIERCQEHGIDVFAHTVLWHIQNPDWLVTAMETADTFGRWWLMQHHVWTLVQHVAGKVIGLDLVNEAGAVGTGTGWGQYLGMDFVEQAFKLAYKTAPALPLYYNSFFDSDDDADLAIRLLGSMDVEGIGVQLHLQTDQDYSAKFDRVRRILGNSAEYGSPVRFSEVTVLDPLGDDKRVAEIFADTIRLMIEYPGVVKDYITWGVKYPAWNGRHVLFDRAGKPTKAFWSVCEELSIGGMNGR